MLLRLSTPGWDRVPYVTTVRDGATPSVVPATREIAANFVVGTYASQVAIDNDDGSAYYSTHDNLLAYASLGLKSDFGGHDNAHARNVYAYVGACFGQGHRDAFVNNSCVVNAPSGGFDSDCDDALAPGMRVSGNAVYNEAGDFGSVRICDATNTVAPWPSDDELIAMGRAKLDFGA